MAKNKNNQAIWSTRVKKQASKLFQKIGKQKPDFYSVLNKVEMSNNKNLIIKKVETEKSQKIKFNS